MTLVARNAFGDLFLRDESGEIFRLDVAVGKLAIIADSEDQFRKLAATHEKREEWFEYMHNLQYNSLPIGHSEYRQGQTRH